MKRLLLICTVLAVAGCAESADDTVDFATGELTFSTLSVDDQCLDGGLNLLFMPEGGATPWDWPFPVKVYGESELPMTYDIQLREPFGQMTVTASDAGENLQQVVAERNVGVLLGQAQFGECVADMEAVVDIQLKDANEVEGIAELTLENPRGDDRCPSEMPASCKVYLRFEARR